MKKTLQEFLSNLINDLEKLQQKKYKSKEDSSPYSKAAITKLIKNCQDLLAEKVTCADKKLFAPHAFNTESFALANLLAQKFENMPVRYNKIKRKLADNIDFYEKVCESEQLTALVKEMTSAQPGTILHKAINLATSCVITDTMAAAAVAELTTIATDFILDKALPAFGVVIKDPTLHSNQATPHNLLAHKHNPDSMRSIDIHSHGIVKLMGLEKQVNIKLVKAGLAAIHTVANLVLKHLTPKKTEKITKTSQRAFHLLCKGLESVLGDKTQAKLVTKAVKDAAPLISDAVNRFTAKV